ncbi:hypothetical protein BDV11DRAFT_177449 [Aspergillus similis]
MTPQSNHFVHNALRSLSTDTTGQSWPIPCNSNCQIMDKSSVNSSRSPALTALSHQATRLMTS